MPERTPHIVTEQHLREEALAVLERACDGGPGAVAAVDAFRSRSPRHARALIWARETRELLRALPERDFSRDEAQRIARQAMWARLAEPQRLAPAVGLLICIVFGAAWFLGTPGTVPQVPAASAEIPEMRRYATRSSGRKVALADGSTIWLDWNTRVEVALSSSLRQVTLEQGRALFAVSKDADRPFIVRAGGLRTRVTGTEFVVQRPRNGPVAVSVMEGSVDVSSDDNRISLVASEAVELTGGALAKAPIASSEELIAWRDGRLVLRDVPLAEAFRELEPYTAYRIDVTQIAGLGARVSGTYFLERANDALQGLIQTHRLQFTQDRSRLVLAPPVPRLPAEP
ncbi:MAG: FecR domain-containing protein [Pseudomonadota bacterium]